MILHIESDTAYLVMPNAKSCIAGYYYLSDHPPPGKKVADIPTRNRPLHIVCKTLQHVVASVAKAETTALFLIHKRQSLSGIYSNNLAIPNHQHP